MRLRSKFETAWADTTEDWIVARTGDWRFQRPVLNRPKCRQCGWCYLYCPVNCLRPTEAGYFEVDLTYCKGCGLCAKECPAGAITMVSEEEVG